MEWLKRLGAAIDYIEENLDKEISYDEAAHIACCSTYYFQRIFSYVSGVSLSEYIRRRKMTQAAFELQRTDNKVIDVAHKYGYSSPTSFNRAFQSVHGIAPIAAKSMGCTLCAYPSIQFSIIVLEVVYKPKSFTDKNFDIKKVSKHTGIQTHICSIVFHIDLPITR